MTAIGDTAEMPAEMQEFLRNVVARVEQAQLNPTGEHAPDDVDALEEFEQLEFKNVDALYHQLAAELVRWQSDHANAGVTQADFVSMLRCPVWPIVGELHCFSPAVMLEQLHAATQSEHDRQFQVVLLPKWSVRDKEGWVSRDEKDSAMLKNARVRHGLADAMVSMYTCTPLHCLCSCL